MRQLGLRALPLLWTAVFFCGLLVGCGTRELKDSSAGAADFPASFSAIRARILEPRCVRCHGSFADYDAVVKYTVASKNSGTGKFVQEVESGRMPENGSRLIEAEVDAIKLWIKNGAHND